MQYLKNNAILQCDKGLTPVMLSITSNGKVKNRDGLFATDKDNIAGFNIPNFTLCSIAGVCRLNLDLSGQQLNWINTVPKVKVMDKKALFEASKCICPLGGIITSINSGQI